MITEPYTIDNPTSALQKLFLTHIIFIGWQVIFYHGHRLELEWNSDY